MTAESFWNSIVLYNQNTKNIQPVFLLLIIVSVIFSLSGKIKNFAKIALGAANLFIAISFFGFYGTENIQKFFALPLYALCGILFIYEAFKNKDDRLALSSSIQLILLFLYCLYPVISAMLNHRFPKIVTYIMPCPIISLSIALYSCYSKKNKLLMLLLVLWGLTGIKALFFNVYEDLILLLCAIYGIFILVKEFRAARKNKAEKV